MTVLDTVAGIFLIMSWLAPFVAFHLLLRNAAPRRFQIVAATGLAGGVPAAIAGALYSLAAGQWTHGLPWAVIGLVFGILVSVLGLLARAFGRWLAAREP